MIDNFSWRYALHDALYKQRIDKKNATNKEIYQWRKNNPTKIIN